jgi:hypothetical protein
MEICLTAKRSLAFPLQSGMGLHRVLNHALLPVPSTEGKSDQERLVRGCFPPRL